MELDLKEEQCRDSLPDDTYSCFDPNDELALRGIFFRRPVLPDGKAGRAYYHGKRTMRGSHFSSFRSLSDTRLGRI